MNAGFQTRSGSYTGSTYKPGLPPGLYEEITPVVRPRLVRLDTAAFVGLAERGPVNTAVPLGSIAEFRAVFGQPSENRLLPEAVNAFFANGGRRCVVVRAMDHADARTARLQAPGLEPLFPLVARSPGAWANRLKLFVTLKRRTLPLRRVTVTTDPDFPKDAIVAPAHRAIPGVTLRLVGPAAPNDLARIVAADKPVRGTARVYLSAALDPLFDTKPELLASSEELTVRLDVFLGEERVETWDDATFDPAHPDFLPRLLGRRSASEALLAPKLSGDPEPDGAWGGEDDPAGSEMLRPGLSAAGLVLKPSQALLDAPNGLMFDAASLIAPLSGDDAALTTDRLHFFMPTPPDPLPADVAEGVHPFSDRPGAVDALLPWDDHNVASPIAMVCMPDLLHPSEPDAEPDAPEADDTPCFGVCVHVSPPAVAPTLPYPLLGDRLSDLQQRQIDLVQSCEALGRRIALLDLPPGLPAGDVVNWRRAMASARAALISPWLRAAPSSGDPLAAPVELPPSAAVAGLIARVELQTGVWLSPGAQTIQGVFGVANVPGQPDPGFLHVERIDAIRATEKGIQLMGSRTTSLDPDWTHINVRRIIDWLMAQLPLDLAWAPFEPNDPRLWNAMTRAAARRLKALFDAGALAGATAEQSWFVRCDRTTMTQNDLDEGRAIMLVGVAPAVPAEFLVFRLVREGGETAAAEVLA